MVLLISYDLNGRERPTAYEAVKDVITQNAISSRKPLYSQWFVETNDLERAWYDRLEPVIDDDDGLFICKVTGSWIGQFEKEIGEWLRARA